MMQDADDGDAGWSSIERGWGLHEAISHPRNKSQFQADLCLEEHSAMWPGFLVWIVKPISFEQH